MGLIASILRHHGSAPAQDGEFRTRPPGPFGGNMDVCNLTAGATLYLPVMRPARCFSTEDAHAAQGVGEVCINGIETLAEVSLRFRLRRDFHLTAHVAETPARPASATAGEWLMVEAHEDALTAAARATSRMVDFIADRWEISPENAYVLCSATMSLRLEPVMYLR